MWSPMRKKRYTLYLSAPLARRFDDIARSSHGGKSALVEEALAASLTPQQIPGLDDLLLNRLGAMTNASKTIERDLSVVTEVLALFVRYFLTVTPPLPDDEQEPARLLGRERFQVFVAQVGRQLAGEQRLVSEVLETIAHTNPDLFGSVDDDIPITRRSTPNTAPSAAPNSPSTNDYDDTGAIDHD
jgi:hypothetical protein